jgi:ferritin-like metal-binding protein YciE
MTRKTLRDLLVDELRDLYHADKQLLRAFPRLAKGASAPEVRKLCEEGVDYSEERIRRLEQAFGALHVAPRGKTFQDMAGLIQEAMEVLDEDLGAAVRNAALLARIQKISHYGIAGYGTACSYAEALGEDAVAALLAESLREKKEADEEMSELAEREINPRALRDAEEDAGGRERADRTAAGDKPKARRRKSKKSRA